MLTRWCWGYHLLGQPVSKLCLGACTFGSHVQAAAKLGGHDKDREGTREPCQSPHIFVTASSETWEATPHKRLYGEALPERGTFFRLELYKRVGIS